MSDPILDTEPSLTTVPDEPRGRRTFTAMLVFACVAAVLALGLMVYRTVTREIPPEEIARRHFSWSSRFRPLRAQEVAGRADVWLEATTPTKPGDGVSELFGNNRIGSPRSISPPKKGVPLPLRLSASELGRTVTVEYDSKRKEYHLWMVDAP